MVAGLEDITAGELRIGGVRVNEKPPRDRDIAMVFQSYALYPHLSVYDNIAFGLKLRKVKKPVVREKVEKAAAVLDLTEYLDSRPRALSGGQRQRVAMGRAIVREPQVFLMDEPLSNLDAKLRVQMRAEIAKLQVELGVTTMYVTHDQVEAMTMGDRVAVIDKGVLQQVARPRDLYLDPDNIFVAGFMGSPPMNMAVVRLERDGDGLVALLDGRRVTIAPQLLARKPVLMSYAGREVAMGLRAEDLKECEEHRDWPEDRRIPATVDLVEALGSELAVHFPVSDDRPARDLTVRPGGEALGALDDQPGGDGSESPEEANMWVANFGPRSFVEMSSNVEIGVDTEQAYFFDLAEGHALRD